MTSKPILTQSDINLLKGTFATKGDLKRLEQSVVTKEEFKNYRSEMLDKLNRILKEIRANRQELTVIAHRVSNHEDRIEKIEEKLQTFSS